MSPQIAAAHSCRGLFGKNVILFVLNSGIDNGDNTVVYYIIFYIYFKISVAIGAFILSYKFYKIKCSYLKRRRVLPC